MLASYGYEASTLVQAEQIHGNQVKAVDQSYAGTTIHRADGLVTQSSDILLVIRTADCGALFIFDPEHRAVGLAHSGKKGTQLNIAETVVTAMSRTYQSDPQKLIAALSPCIRPPHYETDFAHMIASQVYASGIRHFTDCGENTATDLNRFYSYRSEKGKTGRHYAFIGIVSG
ncbi:MAG: polyphenol oxidase family protein [Verrucomicrobiota bacterium]